MKKVYIAMSADIIHNGHINIVEEGAKYGEVIIGVLTDEAIASYKKAPILNYEIRKKNFNSIKNVSKVVKQETLDYTQNLEALKPDYVLHGDDWKTGIQSLVREKVIKSLEEWGGQLIEIPYTNVGTIRDIRDNFRNKENTPDVRRAMLKKLINTKPYIRAIEVSNGLSGIVVENIKIEDKESACIKEYDAMWISSLCDSAFKGKPDIELVDLTSRINTINEIMEVTTKPIILDADTGGKVEHLVYNVKTLERLGVSAIIVEDKTGLKQNSLFGTDVAQTLDDPDEFAAKLHAAKVAQVTKDFMIIARLESLIAGKDVDDALMRAKKYIAAGCDGVMIHSKEKSGSDIFEFLDKFRQYSKDIPVILVPTTYNHFTEEELYQRGANVVIHANHLLRSAYPAMMDTAKCILETGRSKEAEERYCMPIKEVLKLVPGGF